MVIFSGCGEPGAASGASAPEVNPPSSEAAASAPAASEEAAAEGSASEMAADIRVGVLKGPSGLGAVQVMNNNDAGTTANRYDFTIAGAPADIQAKLINGELDIAAVPINVAAALYNKTEGKVRAVAVSTLGVLYLLTKGEAIGSIADLAGKTVYATGQGSTPEYVLNYLLAKSGVGDSVTVEYKAEHAELAALMLSGNAPIAMLPQPFVTTVMQKDSEVKIAVDVNDAWKQVSGTELAMTCIVARTEFLDAQPKAAGAFMDEYKASSEFVNANLEEAAALSEKYDIIPEAVAKAAIPKCNIVFIDGDAMKAAAGPVLAVLMDANPQSVGGTLPDDAFYYKRQA